MRSFALLGLLAAICISFTSCRGARSYPKNEKHQIELTLQKLRADLEEVKHDVHTQNMEVSVLDGKILNHEDALATIRRDTLESHGVKLEKTETQLHQLEKKLSAVEGKTKALETNLEKLLYNWKETKKALTQSKAKLNEIEDSVVSHTEAIRELSVIKKDLEKLSLFVHDPIPEHMLENYRVRTGETLELIAKKRQTNIAVLMQINQLETSNITAGQNLLVPIILGKSE